MGGCPAFSTRPDAEGARREGARSKQLPEGSGGPGEDAGPGLDTLGPRHGKTETSPHHIQHGRSQKSG